MQAILFHRPQYNLSKAEKWIAGHNYRPLKYHLTDNYVRARLHEPDYNKYKYRTINLDKNIKAISMYSDMPGRRRPQRRQPRARRRVRRTGGALDPVDLLANLVIPALAYAGISYGIYRAVKK